MRKRYVVFKIEGGKFKFRQVSQAILNQCLQLYGEVGASRLRLWVLEDLFDEENQKGVIVCSHLKVPEIRAALALIREIGDKKVIFHTLGITGTIKSAKNKFLYESRLKV